MGSECGEIEEALRDDVVQSDHSLRRSNRVLSDRMMMASSINPLADLSTWQKTGLSTWGFAEQGMPSASQELGHRHRAVLSSRCRALVKIWVIGIKPC
ncbi:hypothetical protein U1Q18_014130 [Sarracenia purpurea var. burkii]